MLRCRDVSLVALHEAPRTPHGNLLPQLLKRSPFVKSWADGDTDRVLNHCCFSETFFIPFKNGVLVASEFQWMFIYQGTIIILILICQ